MSNDAQIFKMLWSEYRQSTQRHKIWYWDFRLKMRRLAVMYAEARGWKIELTIPQIWLGRRYSDRRLGKF